MSRPTIQVRESPSCSQRSAPRIAWVLAGFQGFHFMMNFLAMPIFFLWGALFPLTNLPKVRTVIAGIDPLSYGVDGLGPELTGVAHFGTPLDLLMLSFIVAALLGARSYPFSRIRF